MFINVFTYRYWFLTSFYVSINFIEMPTFEMRVKEIRSLREAWKISKLENKLFSKWYPPVARDNIVGVIDMFNKLNQGIQKMVWKRGFFSWLDQSKMVIYAKKLFFERHFDQFYNGNNERTNVKVHE